MEKDCVIIEQGYKQNEKNFYIILRGIVAIMVRDEVLDEDEQIESNEHNINEFLDHDKMETDRNKLGIVVNHLGDGKTFGELALINDDNHRTASVVADDVTDLICISKELYERTVGKLIKQDFESKLDFVEKNMLFKEWPIKWRRHIATCFHWKKLSYDEVLVKQGEPSNHIYFITKGELKLVADPDLHNEHFPDFLKKMSSEFEEDVYNSKSSMTHFGLQQYYSPMSRQAKRLKSANDDYTFNGEVQSVDLRMNKLILSPSARRKMNAQTRAKMHRKYNVCYLEAGQQVGDVEFLTGLDNYHGTAISTSQETVVIELHYIQFNRYFRKKNPETVEEMTKALGKQMPRRLIQEHISKNVPLLKCIMAKLDDLNGTSYIKRKRKQDDDTLSELECASTGAQHRAKSGVSSRSFPLTNKPKNGLPNKYASFGFNLPEMNEQALAKYLNTQVNQVLKQEEEEETEENNETQENTTDESSKDLEQNKTAGGVHIMAKVERPKKEEKKIREMHPRTGIFFKVLQVSNPNIEKEQLAIEEEEFNYLCQIKRRITKELHKFYPFASLESFLSLGEDGLTGSGRGGGRICKRMVQTASGDTNRRRRTVALPKKTALKTRSVSAETGARKNVGFSLP